MNGEEREIKPRQRRLVDNDKELDDQCEESFEIWTPLLKMTETQEEKE